MTTEERTMSTTLIPERLEELQQATIHAGHGLAPPNEGGECCAADWAAYLAGEEHSDTPPCTDMRLARLVHVINDGIAHDDERSEQMRRLAPLLVGTAGHEQEIAALLDRLAVRRLREIVLPLAPHWPEDLREGTVAAIEGVCDAIEGGGDRYAARRAARHLAAWSAVSAESAAQSARSSAHSAQCAAQSAASAAQCAAVSAAGSAEFAARSVWFAARSPSPPTERSAARSAAASQEADFLIAELERFHD